MAVRQYQQLLGLHYSREWEKSGSHCANIPRSPEMPSDWTTLFHHCAREDVQGHVAAQVVVAYRTTLGGAVHPDCAASPGTEEVGSSPLWVSVSSSVR